VVNFGKFAGHEFLRKNDCKECAEAGKNGGPVLT
jgi:hypothetical protein